MIRFTPEEYELLLVLARQDEETKRIKTKERNLSAYIRKCIFQSTGNPLAIKKEVKDLTYQMRKIGVNINQVVTKVNAGYAVPVDIDNLVIYLKKVEEEFFRLEKILEEWRSWPSQN